MDSPTGRYTPGPRGQTSPVGVALILGIVLLGSTVALTAAATVIGDTQRNLDADRAEQALTQLDSKVALVALGDANTQTASLSGTDGGAYDVREDAGWMNVTVNDTTAGTTQTMFNATMGSVVFENEERSVAYQGGGVWRGAGNGSFMVSPPEFYYRDATLTLPLVTVSGDHSLTGDVGIDPNGSSVQHYPNVSANPAWENPLEHGVVEVTVHSEYYQAWGRYWETRTDGDVAYDHARDTASLTLVVPAGNRRVTSAVAATGEGGELTLAGSGSATTRVDNYNSSQGDYASTATEDGRVVTAGDVSMSGNSIVEGTVESGGFVEVKGASEVTDDVLHSDGTHISGTVGGSIDQISGVEGDPPIDAYVHRRYRSIDDDNNNTDTGAISGDSLDSGSQTLDAGRYHLNQIHLTGSETLTLDTGSGEIIELAVRDHIYLNDGAEIRVQGTGQVRVFVDGQTTGPTGDHFAIDNNGGEVDVDDENATQFWMYGTGDFRANIDGTSATDHRYVGVIYAPGGPSGTSRVRIEKGDLFGSAVAAEITMDNGGSVHFDDALRNERAVPPDQSIVRVTYMHVSHTRVTLTD